MGLTHSAYMIGTFLSSYLVALLISLVYLIPCYIGGVWNNTSLTIFEIFFSYFLYVISLVNMIFFLSSFFNNHKIGSDVISIITMIFSFSYLFIFLKTLQENKLYIFLISIIPTASLNFSWFKEGWWLISINDTIEKNGLPASFSEFMIYLVISGSIYLLLYIYIDEIWPNEFGTQKHPLYCFKNCRKKKQRTAIKI